MNNFNVLFMAALSLRVVFPPLVYAISMGEGGTLNYTALKTLATYSPLQKPSKSKFLY